MNTMEALQTLVLRTLIVHAFGTALEENFRNGYKSPLRYALVAGMRVGKMDSVAWQRIIALFLPELEDPRKLLQTLRNEDYRFTRPTSAEEQMREFEKDVAALVEFLDRNKD